MGYSDWLRFWKFLNGDDRWQNLFKINPTEYGSHNPGTANMGAVFGKKMGYFNLFRRFA